MMKSKAIENELTTMVAEYPIPQERLRVFISSAQRAEHTCCGDFDWSGIRRLIKNTLSECPFIDAFIIEDICSGQPSTQIMENEVRRADCVVLLAYGEIRTGTEIEYTAAMKYGIPIMAYFFAGGFEKESLAKAKGIIQENDYCTYRMLASSDKVGHIILNDIIEDCIRTRKYKKLKSGGRESVEETNLELSTYETAFIAKKELLKEFGECYSALPVLLGITENNEYATTTSSPISRLGINAQKWIVNGEAFGYSLGELELLEYAKEDIAEKKWLAERWKAIDYRLEGNLERALEHENKALEIAKASNAPEWLINDILIDCRNLKNTYGNMKQVFFIENPAQEQLNKLKSPIYLPVADRYMENALEILMKEEIEIMSQHYSVRRYGSSFYECLRNIQNYLFTAMYYGSITHIYLCRFKLAQILYKYGTLFSEDRLIYQSAKLYLLGGNIKEYRNIVNQEWGRIYSFITAEPDYLWQIACNSDLGKRDESRWALIETIGMYLSDQQWKQAEMILLEYTKRVTPLKADSYFKALKAVLMRMDVNVILRILTELIDENRYHNGSWVSSILSRLNYETVSDEDMIKLCKSIEEHLPKLLRDGFNPQAIAILQGNHADIAADLNCKLLEQNINTIDSIIYKLNIGGDNWNELMEEAVKREESYYNQYKDGMSYAFSAYDICGLIASLVIEHETEEIKLILEKEFFPLCEKVLKSNIAASHKYSYIDTLCKICSEYIHKGYKIPSSLQQTISELNIHGDYSDPFRGVSGLSLSYKTSLLKYIIGSITEEALLTQYIICSNCDEEDRVCLSECLKTFAEQSSNNNQKAREMLRALAIKCSKDDQQDVRLNALDCIVTLYSIEDGAEEIVKCIQSYVCDPSHKVRFHLAKLCNNNSGIDDEFKRRLLDILKEDAHYSVKAYAIKAIDSRKH